MSLTLALVSALGCGMAMGSCKRNNGEDIDTNKTQLYVSTYSGGYGSAWLDDLKVRFEEAYADKTYEDNKTGVQIVIDDNEASGASIALAANSNEVIFTESVPYYNWVKSKSIIVV